LCSIVIEYFDEAVLRPIPAAPGGNCPRPLPALSNATAPAAAATTHDAATAGDADDDEDEEAVGPACETRDAHFSR